MVRTNRGGASSANVDALDNLNLDDMFADGGDELFDGLDIDLGNMDDITGGNNASLSAQTTASQPMAPPPPEEPSTRTRRKTKRKPRSRFGYDDDDDDSEEPVKKKAKTTKTATKKRPSKKAAFDESSASRGSGKGKQKVRGSVTTDAVNAKVVAAKSVAAKAVTAIPVAAEAKAATGSSTVAAAGQFGGRNKRGGSFVKSRTKLPTRTSSTGDGKKVRTPSVSSEPGTAAVAVPQAEPKPAPRPATFAEIFASHPGLTQSPYCGLSPSNTLFYPFLPALPSESIIKTRKTYAMIDRIHSSLLSHLQGPKAIEEGITPAKETDGIFKLLQEAYREPSDSSSAITTERGQAIGLAIGALRRTITFFDRPRLAGDLYALAVLLKRQHDFLKQNMDNMEKWSKANLPQEEYESVYVPHKALKKRKADQEPPPVSVLKSFGTAELKLRLLCSGFKEPKGNNKLVALLPPHLAPQVTEAPKVVPKTKKRKTSTETTKPVAWTTSAAAITTVTREVALTYSDCTPFKRRKHVSDLITRTARELETKYQQQIDERKQVVCRQENDLQKLAAEDEQPVLQTTGMWRWLEKSNIFGSLTEKEVRNRLDPIRYPYADAEESDDRESSNEGLKPVADGSLVDRLTSLLVEEDVSEDGSITDETDLESIRFEYGYLDDGGSLLDLASLTAEERTALHLRAIGLVGTQFLAMTEQAPSRSKTEDFHSQPNAIAPGQREKTGGSDGEKLADGSSKLADGGETENDVEAVLRRMTSDLCKTTALNNKRANYLETMSDELSAENLRRKRDAETALVAKCQQVIKKNKELKIKSGKAKGSKNDESALPW